MSNNIKFAFEILSDVKKCLPLQTKIEKNNNQTHINFSSATVLMTRAGH